MKILYITDMDLSSNTAPLIHAKEVINNLSGLGNELFFIGQKLGNLDIDAKTKYIPVPKVNILKGIYFNANLLFKLPFFIWKNQIDFIYSRQGQILITPAIISKLFSLPYLTELNGNIEEEMNLAGSPKIFVKIAITVEKFCYRTAKKIIVMTPNLKRYIHKKYNLPLKKIKIVENGVDSNLLKPLDKNICKTKRGLEKNIDYLCYVGNFASWQGLDSLVESLKFYSKKFPNLKLLLVGDGELKEILISLSKRYGLENRIIFTGKVKHGLIPYYIGASEICFAPFTKERNKKMGSSAFKMYEYASCGKPIITTHPDFVTKNKCGLVAKGDNPEDLAKKTIKLLGNKKLLKELGDNGRKAILKGYSWKNVAKRTEKIIKEAIKENKK